MTGIEAIVMHSQLRWCGHLTRMPDHRIPQNCLLLRASARFQAHRKTKETLLKQPNSWGPRVLTSTAGSRQLPLGARGVRPAAQEWWATKISKLLVRCRDENVARTSPQHRQLSPVNMSALSVDAGVQQRSAWCPIRQLTSSTDQRLICLSRQETPSCIWILNTLS